MGRGFRGRGGRGGFRGRGKSRGGGKRRRDDGPPETRGKVDSKRQRRDEQPEEAEVKPEFNPLMKSEEDDDIFAPKPKTNAYSVLLAGLGARGASKPKARKDDSNSEDDEDLDEEDTDADDDADVEPGSDDMSDDDGSDDDADESDDGDEAESGADDGSSEDDAGSDEDDEYQVSSDGTGESSDGEGYARLKKAQADAEAAAAVSGAKDKGAAAPARPWARPVATAPKGQQPQAKVAPAAGPDATAAAVIQAALTVPYIPPYVPQDSFNSLFLSDPLGQADEGMCSAAAAQVKQYSAVAARDVSNAGANKTTTGVQATTANADDEEEEDADEPVTIPARLVGAGEGAVPPLLVSSLSLMVAGARDRLALDAAASAGSAGKPWAAGKIVGSGAAGQQQSPLADAASFQPGWDATPLYHAVAALVPPASAGAAADGDRKSKGKGSDLTTGAHTAPVPALYLRSDGYGKASATLRSPTGAAGSGYFPLPPPCDLVRSWAVRPKVAAAWTGSYGQEVQELLRSALRQASATADAKLRSALAASLQAEHPFSPLQSLLWPALAAHADLYFPARTTSNARELRTVACLHIANHVSRAHAAVEAHNAALKERALQAKQARLAAAAGAGGALDGADETGVAGAGAGGGAANPAKGKPKPGHASAGAKAAPGTAATPASSAEEQAMEFRDQGFTRPRVLVLLPNRHAALVYVRTLLRLLAPDRDTLIRGGLTAQPQQGQQGTGQAGSGAGFADASVVWATSTASGVASAAELASPTALASELGSASQLSSVAVGNRNRFFREFGEADDEEDDGAGPGAAGAAAGHNTGRQSATDDAEDEADRTAEAELKRSGGKLSAPGVVRLLAKRRKQQMSDDEDDEDGSNGLILGSGAGGADASGAVAYPFAVPRQGWPAGLLQRMRRERRGDGDEEDDGSGSDGVDDHHGGRGSGQGGSGTAAADSVFDPARPPKGPKRSKHEPRRKDKSETIGDNLKAVAEAEARAERAARKEARARAAAAARGGPAGPRVMPADFTAMMRGNIDDDFRLGIGLGRKNVRLYADFYSSDILLASPLGLRRIIGGEGDKDKDRDTDFLSSIETVILDGCEHLLQQNWQHVRDIFGLMNVTPRKPRETIDFSRVRESTLSGHGRHLRQTIVFSAFPDPDLSALLRKSCASVVGGLSLLPSYGGQLSRVIAPVRQVFLRLPGVTNLAGVDDARFGYFRDRLMPELLAEGAVSASGSAHGSGAGGGGATTLTGTASHVLIFIPSYFDYVRLRNLLDSKEAEFVTCSEYSDDKDVKRARQAFASGDSPILLMTERFHYFRRYRIKGIRHIIFYGPPQNAQFYPELLNLLQEAVSSALPVSCTVLYSRYDAPTVERLVGSDRAGRLLEDAPGSKSTFVFV